MPVSIQSLAKQLLPSKSVIVIKENILSVIPTCDDVVKSAWHMQAWFSRHRIFHP